MQNTLGRHELGQPGAVTVDEILSRPDVLPGQQDMPARWERRALLLAMRTTLDTWEWDFLHTSGKIPEALLDGRLTEDLLNAYPTDHTYPEHLSKAIARQAGVVVKGDGIDMPDVEVDLEAVGVGIDAIRGAMAGDVGIHENAWSFYPETLEQHGLTLERVGELMRFYASGSLTDAARLIMAAHAIPLEETR